ncbi:WD repeat-containing protein LWD2-like [Euphorbia lathyris]|uniref:WD repeat-containing protein LWD2-like n=1 Tax=Euphorbia lathyris TaxID=212925 RepID=UPI003313731B
MQSPSQGVYTYTAPWPIYSLAWSIRHDKKYRLAIGSSLEDYNNKIEILQFNLDSLNFESHLLFDHPFAPTNLMFFPFQDGLNPDIIATSGDFLRLWHIHDDRVELKSVLNGNRSSEFSSAITSFDWADFDVSRIATSSVDTTCTVWDVEKETVDSQLVAHDKEVYDISWGGYNVFASVSGDGSVRVFDLRNKERSTIIYENPIGESPLLRVEWNKCDPRFVGTVGMDSNKVVIIDIRYPITPWMELSKHKASVNAISWAPVAGRNICSAGDDCRALIWEMLDTDVGFPEGGDRSDAEPHLWFESTAEINNVRWSPVDSEWIAIASLNKLQILKV